MIEFVSSAPVIVLLRLANSYLLSTPQQPLVHPQFSFTAVEAFSPLVVGSLPPLEELDAPVYDQIHQEQIVAGETTQHRVGHPAVQEQVAVQEIPQAPQVVDSSPLLGDVTASECNQVLLPPVLFQEIPEVQVVASQTALSTSFTSTSSGVPAATHAATAFLDDEQMLLRYQAQTDQCVHMLKTKKEMIERCEKQVAALLERVPRAFSSRDRRVLHEQVDEFHALILHQRQLVQPIREQLALSCGNCKRSANVLLMIAWTRRCLLLLLPGERKKAGTKNELWTVYELANRRPGAVYKYRAQGQVQGRAHAPDLCR